MPNKPRTQHRSVRIDDPEWDDAEEATAAMGTDRAKAINQFLRWYLRRPGATLPERPTAAFWAARRRDRDRDRANAPD